MKAKSATKTTMKAKSAMKAMKSKSTKKSSKAMKVSKIAKGKIAKSSVFRGTKVATSGGLKKNDLIRNKDGKVVSKKASVVGKKLYKQNGLDKWTKAVQQARKSLGIKGFQIIGGKTSEGQALLKKARALYKK